MHRRGARGPGDPDDGKGEQGFKCLEKTSKLLVKFARATSKCRKEDAKAVADGEPSNLDACINLRELENVGDLVSAMEKLVSKNGTVDQCVIRGECTENDDPFRCSNAVIQLAGEESKLGAVADGSDIEGRTEQCRDGAHDVLIEVAKGAGDCREDDAKAQRQGQTFDLAGCLADVVDRWAERLAGVLAKASDKGVGPDRCVPDSCTPADSPGSCARTALETSPASEQRALLFLTHRPARGTIDPMRIVDALELLAWPLVVARSAGAELGARVDPIARLVSRRLGRGRRATASDGDERTAPPPSDLRDRRGRALLARLLATRAEPGGGGCASRSRAR